jgi:hypothetical protein
LDLHAAPLLDWAGRRGGPLDPRAAEAVLGLLALSGARRRTGLPEPAPELVEELMLTLLPLYVSAGPAELAGFPAALAALIGYTHEAGKLNARRRDRLVAAVEALQPQFEAAMTSPHRATWARLYGQLLRAEGADAADPQAVGAWVDAFACRPYPQRRAALGLEALDDFTGPDSGGAAPLASAAFFRALIGERSRQAHLLLRQRLSPGSRRTRRPKAPGTTPRPVSWRTAGRRPGWMRCCAGVPLSSRPAWTGRPHCWVWSRCLPLRTWRRSGPASSRCPLCRCPPLPENGPPPCARPRWPQRWPLQRLTRITRTRRCWTWR